MVYLGIAIILFLIFAPIIAPFIESARTPTIEKRLDRKYQDKLASLKSEIATKDTEIAALKKRVAYYEDLQESFASRWQQLIERERKADEKERDLDCRDQLVAKSVDSIVAERERDLERRKRDLDEIIAREVEKGIKGKQKGIDKNWVHIMRKAHVLEEHAQEVLKRAKAISEHLGVPLERILTPREKRFIRELAKEFTVDPRR